MLRHTIVNLLKISEKRIKATRENKTRHYVQGIMNDIRLIIRNSTRQKTMRASMKALRENTVNLDIFI